MNNKEDLLDLLHLKLAGIIEKEDDEYVERLLQQDEETRRLWQELQQPVAVQEYFNHIQPLILKEIGRRITRPQRGRRLRKGALALVASALVALMGWLWMQYRPFGSAVPPGSLALPIAADATAWDTLTVPRNGKLYTMILSDSSVVRLNPGTQLIFPVSFTGKQREVYLEGKGYFEVMHDDRKPFIVHTAKATITVLGTSFSVNAYDGHFSTTLIEGKIKVTAGVKSVTLMPGNKAVLDSTTGCLAVQEPRKQKPDKQELPLHFADDQLVNCTLEEMGRTLERVYHIEVVVEVPAKDRHIYSSVAIYKTEPLQKFLENMQYLDEGFIYEWKGDTLYLR